MIGRQSDMAVVAEANNGPEAVELWRTHRPDVTLVDLRMPMLDGVGVITESDAQTLPRLSPSPRRWSRSTTGSSSSDRTSSSARTRYCWRCCCTGRGSSRGSSDPRSDRRPRSRADAHHLG
jgi:hypothetical protein